VTGVNKLPKYVESIGDRVGAVNTRPETETIVVFGGEDDTTHASLLSHVDPLAAIEGFGSKDLPSFLSGTPFDPSECVRTKMTEHIDFHTLPNELFWRGYRTKGLGGVRQHRTS
jgi:hypothetical protein